MVFNEMELLFGIDLVDFASNIHLAENLIDSTDLLVNLSKDRCAIKGATDHRVPVSAVLSQYFLVPVAY